MSWDDGKHIKVKKVQLTYDDEVIYSIQATYEGSLQSIRRGSVGPKSAEFTLVSDEYVTGFSSYNKRLNAQDVVTELTFFTNKNNKYGPYGKKTDSQVSAPGASGKQIVGFFGKSSNILNSLDVHYGPIPDGTGGSGGNGDDNVTEPQKLGAEGGEGGKEWDDGSDHDNVAKIYVRSGGDGNIQYVKFDYIKDGQLKQGVIHGEESRGSTKEFLINHLNYEYLVSVQGWCNPTTNIVMGIQFKTNSRTFDYVGYEYDGSGNKFTLQVQNKKIIGFHGFAQYYINSIGAYFVPIPNSVGEGGTGTDDDSGAQNLGAEGGKEGNEWDDGSDHDGLTKINVGTGGDGIQYVKFDYVKGQQPKQGTLHGSQNRGPSKEIVIKHPEEYLLSVEGWYDSNNVILGIKFNTNKKTSENIGFDYFQGSGTKFTLQVENKKIIGFHGSSSNYLNSIGAYFVPISS